MSETTTPLTPTAWDDENSYVVAYGTHDAVEAQRLYVAYLREVGFKPGDEEWSDRANMIEFYEGMARLWTERKDNEEPFDTFTEPGEGREPYMYGSL